MTYIINIANDIFHSTDYKALVSRWQIPDISQFAFRNKGVKKEPKIPQLPIELSQQRISPPQGTSRRVSSSLQDPPRVQGAPVSRFTRLALDQAAADLEKTRNWDDGTWHTQVDPTASDE